MSKKLMIALLPIGLLFVLIGCSDTAINSPTPTPLPQIVTSERITFTVERGPITSQREVAAEIVPAQQDVLYFRSSGYINRILVRNGDYFLKGDVLAELQLDDLLDQLQQAQIDLQVSEDSLASEKLQRAYDVQQAQSDTVIAQKQVDLAKLRIEQSAGSPEAQINLDIAQEKLKTSLAYLALIEGKVNTDREQVVKRNQLAVDRLSRMVSDRQLIAPYDGVVLYTGLIPGTQATAYNMAAVIGDPTNLVIRTQFEYELVNNVDANTVVDLYITKDKQKLYPVKFIPGFLPITMKKEGISIDSVGTTTVNYLFFTVPAEIPRDLIPVGSQVYLKIVLGSKQDALLLPPPAIRGSNEFKYVIVLEDDVHRRVEVVQIGIKTDNRWEVIADLKEGDQILGP